MYLEWQQRFLLHSLTGFCSVCCIHQLTVLLFSAADLGPGHRCSDPPLSGHLLPLFWGFTKPAAISPACPESAPGFLNYLNWLLSIQRSSVSNLTTPSLKLSSDTLPWKIILLLLSAIVLLQSLPKAHGHRWGELYSFLKTGIHPIKYSCKWFDKIQTVSVIPKEKQIFTTWQKFAIKFEIWQDAG